MREAVACAGLMPDFFAAVTAGDWEAAEAVKQKVEDREAAADELKNALRSHLPKGLFMPVDRRDLLEILQTQDSIADTAQDIVELVSDRHMAVPEALVSDVTELVASCAAVVASCGEIVEELDELVSIGFSGRVVDRVLEMINALNKQEDATDELEAQLNRSIFKLEGDLDAVSVIMWYRLVEWIADLADYAEKVGDRLRLLMAR